MAFYSSFAQHYDLIFPFKQRVFDFLKSYTNAETRDILDLGCGTGHYAARFSREGLQAIGIDLDSAMIAYAQKHYPETRFFVSNMLEMHLLNLQFDIIFCIGNTAAHVTRSEFGTLLKRVYQSLRPGGRWIFQVRNWDYVVKQKDYTFPILQTVQGSIRFFRTYTNISKDRLTFNTRLEKNSEDIFNSRVILYPLSSQQYLDLHAGHRFLLVDHFSDFQRTPFDVSIDSANIFVFQKS